MIQTALKHLIYEICINKIFEGIQENFHLYDSSSLYNFSVGDHLQIKIYFADRDHTFKKCKIAYKKGKRMVIDSFDAEIPIHLVLSKGILIDITAMCTENYEDYFEHKFQ